MIKRFRGSSNYRKNFGTNIPGSSYYKIGKLVADWLSVVKECTIDSSTREISQKLKDIHLKDDEVMISFDVSSLYTNVPVMEAINDCADLLFSGKYRKPPVSKEVFIQLSIISSCNVLMLTHDGLYKQIDGLAMGSPPAPCFANGWLSKFDNSVKGNAKLFSRYMDDILREIKESEIGDKLHEINNYHPNLKFTIERENEASLPFLDMRIIRNGGRLTSSWYTKSTDTGLTMNFHALAPRKYKKSVVSGIVYRIFNACSTWNNFDTGLKKAKKLLENNQYPPSFYEPIIEKTLNKIIKNGDNPSETENESTEQELETRTIFIQYRGKVTDKFENALKRLKAPCKFIATLKKTKTCLPSLKQPVDKPLKSCVVYHISCPRCPSCYVGQTSRHLITRLKEHNQVGKPVRNHFDKCECELTMDDVKIIARSTKSLYHLMTLEALQIKAIKPDINTRKEYKRLELTIKM